MVAHATSVTAYPCSGLPPRPHEAVPAFPPSCTTPATDALHESRSSFSRWWAVTVHSMDCNKSWRQRTCSPRPQQQTNSWSASASSPRWPKGMWKPTGKRCIAPGDRGFSCICVAGIGEEALIAISTVGFSIVFSTSP